MNKTVLIIDGMGLVFRAYYSFIQRPLRTSLGKNTSALYGFVRMLNRLIKDLQPYSLVVTYDVGRRTFRNELYQDYKAHRPEAPDELREQIPEIQALVEAMGLPFYYKEGYEADDVIGTLAEAWKQEYDVRIVSGDKDLFQLVDDRVRILALVKGVTDVRDLDREGVFELKGVYPEQIVDYLAILGDSSDNIPGVKGIGEKGAVKLLQEYGSLDEIYRELDRIKGAVQTRLTESRDAAYLSRDLATIRRDVPLAFRQPQALDVEAMYSPRVRKMLAEWEMQGLAEEMTGSTPQPETPAAPAGKYFLIKDREEWLVLAGRIRSLKRFSLAFINSGGTARDAEIIGAALSVREKEGFYIPLRHPGEDNLPEQEFWADMQSILEDPAIRKAGHNLKSEISLLQNRGIRLAGLEMDTMVGAYLLDASRSSYSLDRLAEHYLEYVFRAAESGTKNTQTALTDLPLEQAGPLAAETADITLRLVNCLLPLLEQQELLRLWEDIDGPLIPVLADMESKGISLDKSYLASMSEELQDMITLLEKKIFTLSGHPFNINSPLQLGTVLYQELGLPVLKKTGKTKQPATDEAVLQELARQHPLPAQLLEYRTCTKLKNTYVDALPVLVHPATGRIHTTYQQTIAATGRLSSTDPNLQNIPIRDELGRRIRQAFIAKEGCRLLSIDYSQIELRLFAHLSEDPGMIQAFREGIDIHVNTAAVMYGIAPSEVSADQRRAAKTINYGISYGMGPFRLSGELGISMTEARSFIERYFERFPGMRDFMAAVLQYAGQHGEVRTLYGRRRPVPELQGRDSVNLQQLSHPQRYAINTVVQGSAADIIKLAMIRAHQVLRDEYPEAALLLQIHDELVFEVPESLQKPVTERMRAVMEGVCSLKVPLVADAGWGRTWGDAH